MIIYYNLNIVTFLYILIEMVTILNSIFNNLSAISITLSHSIFLWCKCLIKGIIITFLNKYIKLSKVNVRCLKIIQVEKLKIKKFNNRHNIK